MACAYEVSWKSRLPREDYVSYSSTVASNVCHPGKKFVFIFPSVQKISMRVDVERRGAGRLKVQELLVTRPIKKLKWIPFAHLTSVFEEQ
jgi:hypothetical protein